MPTVFQVRPMGRRPSSAAMSAPGVARVLVSLCGLGLLAFGGTRCARVELQSRDGGADAVKDAAKDTPQGDQGGGGSAGSGGGGGGSGGIRGDSGGAGDGTGGGSGGGPVGGAGGGAGSSDSTGADASACASDGTTCTPGTPPCTSCDGISATTCTCSPFFGSSRWSCKTGGSCGGGASDGGGDAAGESGGADAGACPADGGVCTPGAPSCSSCDAGKLTTCTCTTVFISIGVWSCTVGGSC